MAVERTYYVHEPVSWHDNIGWRKQCAVGVKDPKKHTRSRRAVGATCAKNVKLPTCRLMLIAVRNNMAVRLYFLALSPKGYRELVWVDARIIHHFYRFPVLATHLQGLALNAIDIEGFCVCYRMHECRIATNFIPLQVVEQKI